MKNFKTLNLKTNNRKQNYTETKVQIVNYQTKFKSKLLKQTFKAKILKKFKILNLKTQNSNLITKSQ